MTTTNTSTVSAAPTFAERTSHTSPNRTPGGTSETVREFVASSLEGALANASAALAADGRRWELTEATEWGLAVVRFELVG